ncbi:MAG: Mpo1-like protein [Candidatus Hodarchaeales archaeon]|jgi:uncharacterized membrane protein YGL010W
MDSVDFYRSFHTHPVNKLIHVFCIPLIVLTTINFLSKFSLQFRIVPRHYNPGTKQIMYKNITIDYHTLIAIYNMYYYIVWNFKIGIVMQIYLGFLYIIGKIWREVDNKWTKHNIIIFASAWILQFIGHAIEGNRPALMTSLSQTVFQAPLLTLEYVYPNLLA